MLGNVCIFTTDKSHETKSSYSTNVTFPVRSLIWGPSDEYVLVGTMDGALVRY